MKILVLIISQKKYYPASVNRCNQNIIIVVKNDANVYLNAKV